MKKLVDTNTYKVWVSHQTEDNMEKLLMVIDSRNAIKVAKSAVDGFTNANANANANTNDKG